MGSDIVAERGDNGDGSNEEMVVTVAVIVAMVVVVAALESYWCTSMLMHSQTMILN